MLKKKMIYKEKKTKNSEQLQKLVSDENVHL